MEWPLRVWMQTPTGWVSRPVTDADRERRANIDHQYLAAAARRRKESRK